MKFEVTKWGELGLRPLQGQFNTAEIETYLLNIPFTTIDPGKPLYPPSRIYLICLDQAGLDYCLNARNDPEGVIPYVCTVVHMDPDYIGIGLHNTDEHATVIKAFLDWLFAKYRCKVTDDYGYDWTQEVAAGGVMVLFNIVPETPETAAP